MKILAIKLRAIGDTVIWTSALSALHRHFPGAEIHTLTYASNAAVLKNHPAVAKAHFLDGRSRFELLRVLWGLRAERFDWLLGFHATTSLCRWAWLTGSGKMALHHHSWNFSPRGSVPLNSPGRLEDAITRDYRVVEAVTGKSIARVPTSIVLTAEESAVAEANIRSQLAAGRETLPRMAFLPGAGHHLRRFPKEQLLPLIARVQKEGRFQPVVIVDNALSQEWDLADACRTLGVPLFDRANLREFMGLVSRAQRVLANDSGPGHMAVALGVQTDFVFGPGCAGDWHPYDRVKNPLHRLHVDCRSEGPRDREEFQFCTVDACPHHRCLKQLEVRL